MLRGIKTLALRMEKHNQSALQIAEYLLPLQKSSQGLLSRSSTAPAAFAGKKQCSGFGGMISFDIGTVENARAIVENVRIFAFAESLGGVESLIGHPASMTHGSVPKEKRMKLGLTDGLVRLSVGIEDVEDLIGDLSHALDAFSRIPPPRSRKTRR